MILHLQRYNIIITHKPRKPILADTFQTANWVPWPLIQWGPGLPNIRCDQKHSSEWPQKWQTWEPLHTEMSSSYRRDRLSYQGGLSQTNNAYLQSPNPVTIRMRYQRQMASCLKGEEIIVLHSLRAETLTHRTFMLGEMQATGKRSAVLAWEWPWQVQ